MKYAIAVTLLLLTACNEGVAELDDRLVWDSEGCAYVIRVDISTEVRRVTGADKDNCPRKNSQ